jgi:hypothetical protein
METFDVQSVEIAARFEKTFAYIADPANLPHWTGAFTSVRDGLAIMQTPTGSTEVVLKVDSSREHGTIDWSMTFPDGAVAKAYSRLIDKSGKCIYSFVLMAPPVPLERLEGALAQQSRTLSDELTTLRKLLEG